MRRTQCAYVCTYTRTVTYARTDARIQESAAFVSGTRLELPQVTRRGRSCCKDVEQLDGAAGQTSYLPVAAAPKACTNMVALTLPQEAPLVRLYRCCCSPTAGTCNTATSQERTRASTHHVVSSNPPTPDVRWTALGLSTTGTPRMSTGTPRMSTTGTAALTPQ